MSEAMRVHAASDAANAGWSGLSLQPLPGGALSLTADTLGRLRRELIWTMGEVYASGLFFRWGALCGQLDAYRGFLQNGSIQGLADVRLLDDESKSETHVF